VRSGAKHALAVGVCLGCNLVVTAIARAAAAEEGFNYPNGALATFGVAGTNTNASTGTAWNFNRSTSATTGAQVVTGDLAYPAYTGLTAATDGHAARPTGATYPGNGYDALALTTPYTQAAYYSLVLNVTDISGQNFARGANGSFFAGLFNNSVPPTADANVGAGLDIKSPDNSPTASTATRYILGVQAPNVAAASRAFDNATTFVQGESVFLVVEYLFNDAGADAVNLYLNPAFATLGAAPPVTPNATSSGDFTGNQNVQSFVLRSNSTLPFGVTVDNVRVGDTWASVTSVPEPATAGALCILGVRLLARKRRRR